MRLYNKQHNYVLDTAHFRFYHLRGRRLHIYTTIAERDSEQEKWCIDFDTEEEAKDKFEELENEVGMFSFLWDNCPALLNSLCFRKIMYEFEDGHHLLTFYNDVTDKWSIRCRSKERVLEYLQELTF